MTPGFRILTVASILGWASLASATAQDPQNDLAAIRKLLEQQNDQIARLSAEVARLSALLDGPRREPSHSAPPPSSPAFVAEPVRPVEPVRPAVAPGQPVHVVVKGDSLDKIAKQYGTTIQDLQKLNKIADPKKLQIGQQLVLPAGSTPVAPETAPEKKEP